MKRRSFILKTTLGTVAGGTALPFVAGCSQETNTTNSQASKADFTSFELAEYTVADLQKAMESGKHTAVSITQLYIDRIKSIDQAGPRVNAVAEINPDALSIAKQLDEERAKGNVRGPLHGIPIIVKDNIDSADQMMTTAGALALAGNKASKDAFIITKLREAGAILLGKANLSEWANFRSTRSSSGWSSRSGQVRNPYITDRNPCGSSSGSGVASSANLCAIAIGTETNGSIVCPSSANGIVGVKPTVGLWSRSGIIPISFNQDTAGPMARTVADAAILLGALVGVDVNDSKTLSNQDKSSNNYTTFLQKNALEGKRIGVYRARFGFHEAVDAQLEDALQALRDAGAELIDIPEIITNLNQLWGPSRLILEYEFKDGVNAYLKNANTDSGVKSLSDVIEWNLANQEKAMPFFKQELLVSSNNKGDLSSKEYQDALALVQGSARNGIDKAMDDFKLDAIVGPTGGPAWQIDVINGDKFGGGSSSPAAWSGYPAITVPAGHVHGLPIGVTFFGRAWDEGNLLGMAYAFEQERKARIVPKFLPALPLA